MDRLIEQLCDDFEAAWQQGKRPSIEAILSQESSVNRADLLFHLLRLETGLRQADGQSPSVDEYIKRFPSESAIIDSVFNDSAAAKASTGRNSNPLDATTDHSSDSPVIRSDFAETVASKDSLGEMIGRYRIKRLLGEGAFGSANTPTSRITAVSPIAAAPSATPKMLPTSTPWPEAITAAAVMLMASPLAMKFFMSLDLSLERQKGGHLTALRFVHGSF